MAVGETKRVPATGETARLRASDEDRESVVALLGSHHQAGRLDLDEFQERVSTAYQSQTVGQLSPLLSDLPRLASPTDEERGTGARRLRELRARPFGELTDGQRALRVLWTVLLAAFSINLVVWCLASATEGHVLYFWPAWVGGPAGAVLGTVTWFCGGSPRLATDEARLW